MSSNTATKKLTTKAERGVYAIEHVPSGRLYVGSSKCVLTRTREHLSRLRNGRHHNSKLQNAWSKYGEQEFCIYALEYTAEQLVREQAWIDALRPYFNICPVAGTAEGRIPSAEHKARISAAKLGHTHSPETVERIKQARARQVMHPEAMEKTHAACRGVPRSPEVRAKIAAGQRGKVVSEATRAKLRVANLGKKLSAETKAKIAAAVTKKRSQDGHESP